MKGPWPVVEERMTVKEIVYQCKVGANVFTL